MLESQHFAIQASPTEEILAFQGSHAAGIMSKENAMPDLTLDKAKLKDKFSFRRRSSYGTESGQGLGSQTI
eukprot:1159341-Pelagomonas_calceolata.AAC.7